MKCLPGSSSAPERSFEGKAVTPQTPRIGIVDYQAGNVRSIESAFEALGFQVEMIRDEGAIDQCTHIVLPGVGAFGHCMDKLSASGLIPRLERWALDEARPLLGICVGMQLMAACGMEMGEHQGLGWLGGRVLPLEARPPVVRVPHVGWNNVRFLEDFGDFRVGDAPDFYFDHSYAYFDPSNGKTIGESHHGVSFSTIVRKGNLVAAQFHPEKSQEAGLKFLQGFKGLGAAC
jgi:glutamine amidotransferase